jgi:hypothetical protein
VVSDALAWEPDEEDLAFTDVYGDWDPLTPVELRGYMEGFPAAWWVVGGHAVEAFTGVRRAHEDIDLVVFSDDMPALRAQFAGVFHLWSNYGGTFRIIDDKHPEPLHPLSQVWMRVNARSPWRVDCPLNPRRDGRWVSKRDDAFVADLEEVTWVAGDGVRYLNPEVVLHFKAAHARVKDVIDRDNVLPLLSADRRAWTTRRPRRCSPRPRGDDRAAGPRRQRLSLHASGRAARRVVEESRERLGRGARRPPGEVVFTGGGTESDNLAVKGLFWARRAADPRRRRIVVSPASSTTPSSTPSSGWPSTRAPRSPGCRSTDRPGRPEALRGARRRPGDVALVSA